MIKCASAVHMKVFSVYPSVPPSVHFWLMEWSLKEHISLNLSFSFTQHAHKAPLLSCLCLSFELKPKACVRVCICVCGQTFAIGGVPLRLLERLFPEALAHVFAHRTLNRTALFHVTRCTEDQITIRLGLNTSAYTHSFSFCSLSHVQSENIPKYRK